jgi:hypothetical protein
VVDTLASERFYVRVQSIDGLTVNIARAALNCARANLRAERIKAE